MGKFLSVVSAGPMEQGGRANKAWNIAVDLKIVSTGVRKSTGGETTSLSSQDFKITA